MYGSARSRLVHQHAPGLAKKSFTKPHAEDHFYQHLPNPAAISANVSPSQVDKDQDFDKGPVALVAGARCRSATLSYRQLGYDAIAAVAADTPETKVRSVSAHSGSAAR